MESIAYTLVVVVICWLCLLLLDQIYMPGPIKTVLKIVVIVVTILVLLGLMCIHIFPR